ncbi:MAG: hypothetical protein V3V20_00135 [Algisphaera sp.]
MNHPALPHSSRPAKPFHPTIAIAATIAALLITIGCQTTAPSPVGKIRTLPHDPTPPQVDSKNNSPHRAVRCVMRIATLPLNRPLTNAWAHVDQKAVPSLSQSIWNANGLRVGVLNTANAEAFGKAMGPPTHIKDQTLVALNRPSVLLESQTLRATFFADLTRPAQAEHIETFRRGQARLLTTMTPTGPASATIRIIPQHHLPRATLLARGPLEKMLDGRIFDELTLPVNIGPGQALVVGYALAPQFDTPPQEDKDDRKDDPKDDPKNEEENDKEATATAATAAKADEGKTASLPDTPLPKDDTPPPSLDIDLDALPLDLGRALMTLGKNPDELQRLFVISVVDTR